MNKIRLAIIIANPKALDVFFRQQVAFLQANGFEVHALCSFGPELAGFQAATGAQVETIEIERCMRPVADLVSVFRLWKALRRIGPDVVHAHTPKAGLLGMIAALAAGVKVRYFTYHGLRSGTLTGWQRTVVSATDRLTSALATNVLAVSPSLRRSIIAQRACPEKKIKVVGYGACAGVDLAAFDPTVRSADDRDQFRRIYAIPSEAFVIGFVGRIAADKGIAELAASWATLRERHPNAWLFFCGFEDADDPVARRMLDELYSDSRVRTSGELVRDMPAVYAGIDVLVLPSYREGFGVAAIEAAAMRVPVVASRIDGIVDAVQDGITGTLVRPHDVDQLTEALDELIRDERKRQSLAAASRPFAKARFSSHRISKGILQEYRETVEAALADLPAYLLPDRHLVWQTQADGGSVAHTLQIGEESCDESRLGRLGALRHGLLAKPQRQAAAPAYRVVKRSLDALAALILLALATPILMAAAIAIRLCLRGPALFRQERGGLHGQTFQVYKLRTMSDARDEAGALLPDHERLTRLGRFLRQTSLDELPQLWNVLKGDMSMVGPRPLLASYLERYSEFEARRHEVRPGITGWVQVQGRNLLSWDEKFRLDIWYVEHASLRLDARILWATLLRAIRPVGVATADGRGVSEFVGSTHRI